MTLYFHIISGTSGHILIFGMKTQSICKLDGACDPPEGGEGENCIKCIDCDAQMSGQPPGALVYIIAIMTCHDAVSYSRNEQMKIRETNQFLIMWPFSL